MPCCQHAGKVLEERFAKPIIKLATQVFVARTETQRRDGLQRELAVKPERALGNNFPVAKCLIREDLGVLGLLKGEVGVTDAFDVVRGSELAQGSRPQATQQARVSPGFSRTLTAERRLARPITISSPDAARSRPGDR